MKLRKGRLLIYPPSSLPMLLFLILILPLFAIFMSFLSLGLRKIGLNPAQALLIMLLSFIGSFVNLIIRERSIIVLQEEISLPGVLKIFYNPPITLLSKQILCINVGGALIPVILSIYLLPRIPLHVAILSIIFVALISKMMSRVVKGIGIIIPAFIPPLLSALIALILYPENPAPIAYTSGVLGTLIGADILNLRKLKNFPGVISIGGAGVFDGIFLTGAFAALLS